MIASIVLVLRSCFGKALCRKQAEVRNIGFAMQTHRFAITTSNTFLST